jgi:hypothetical protein
MSVLTRVDGIPVYTSIDEALEWGRYNAVAGYHIHKHMSVTGYMGGKTHGTARRTIELPVEIKGKPGYSPKVGSRIISIVKGERVTTKVTANTVYDRRGFPIATDEDKFETLPRIELNTPTPVAASVAVVTSAPGGGGGY